MHFQIGAMSVGDILDRGLKLLLARLPLFYAVNLIALTPTLLFQLVLPFVQQGARGSEIFAVVVGGGLVSLVLSLITGPIGQAATLYIIAQEFVDQHAGFGESFRFALH